MMIGERNHGCTKVHVPPWSATTDDNSIDDYSFFFDNDSLKAFQHYLLFNSNDAVSESQFPDSDTTDFQSCDHFRMYEFKIRKCTRGRSHDWTECPFAHPGEKARRRDPRKYNYSGTACPDFRKGNCFKGDSCEFAHGVFECWLHPARYRTQPCKDGMNCKRRVCFFAHSLDQLRVLSPRADSYQDSLSSPTESPPVSPNAVNEMAAALRQLHLNKVKSMPSSLRGGCSSPRMKMTPPGYFSMPTTPTGPVVRQGGVGYFDEAEEEEGYERVESGRDLRAKMFEKLSKENPLDRVDHDQDVNPDVGWVSELIQ